MSSSSISSLIASLTSSRTALLKRRRRSSISTASRRSSASSSSKVRSALRVTRNAAASSIVIPKNRVSSWAMIRSSTGRYRVVVDLDEPREHGRDLDPDEPALAVLGVGSTIGGDAEGEVGDVRERVAGSTASGVSTGKMRCS